MKILFCPVAFALSFLSVLTVFGTSLSAQAGNEPRLCAGFEQELIYSVSNFDGDQVCPTKGQTRILYVSVNGNDRNDGLSSQKPLKSSARAVQTALKKDQTEDWVVFKRGDVFYGQNLGLIRLDIHEAGQSKTQPLVFSAYGEGTKRPTFFKPGHSPFKIWGSKRDKSTQNKGFITISGLHFKSTPGTGGGWSMLWPSTDVVIEDNFVEGFGTHGIQRGTNRTLVQDNIIVDNSSGPGAGGHSQGVFTHEAQNTIFRGNLIDRNGWYGDRTTGYSNTLLECWLLDQQVARTFPKEQLPSPNGYLEDASFWVIEKDFQKFVENNRLKISPYREIRFGQLNPSTLQSRNNRLKINYTRYREYLEGYEDFIRSCPPGFSKVYHDGKATIFNHNLYFQYDGHPTIVEDNLISRSASHGVQSRGGGRVDHNIFSRNPLNIMMGSRSTTPEFQNTVHNNVVLEGNDINEKTDRGFGIDHSNASNSTIQHNVIAHMHPSSKKYNNSALGITCTGGVGGSSGTFNGDGSGCSTTISNNLVYNWTDHERRQNNMLMVTLAAKIPFDDVLVTENVFVNEFGRRPDKLTTLFFSQDGSDMDIGERIRFSKNTYIHPNIMNEDQGLNFNFVKEKNQIGFEGRRGWQRQYEQDATALSTKTDFKDTCRTLVTYYDDMILGNTSNDNCEIMHSDALYEAFMQYIRKNKNRLTPNEKIETRTIINYIRDGFDLAPL